MKDIISVNIAHRYEREELRTWYIDPDDFNNPRLIDEIKSKYLDYQKGKITGEQFQAYIMREVGQESHWDGKDVSDEFEIGIEKHKWKGSH